MNAKNNSFFLILGRAIAALTLCIFAVGCAPVQTSHDIPVLQQEIAPSIYGITYDTGRNKLYVAEAGPQARTQPSNILQLDPQTLAVEKAIEFSDSVFDVVLNGDGSRLYALHTTDNAFSMVDLGSGEIQQTVALTRERTAEDAASIVVTRKIVVDDRNERLFLAETTWPDGMLFVVNARTLMVEKILPHVGLFAMGMVLDAAGNRLFIGNMDHEIVVFDTRSLNVLHRWKVNVDQPISLAYDALRNLLYVSDQGREYWTHFMTSHAPHYQPLGAGNKVLVINAATGAPEREIQTGTGPLELRLTEDGKRLFVTQREDGSVAVYDTETGRQIQRYALPVHPNSMALDEQGRRLFITVKESIENETLPESVARIHLPDWCSARPQRISSQPLYF